MRWIHRRPTSSTWLMSLLVLTVGAGAAKLIDTRLGKPSVRIATPSTDCESWDRTASAHVATLVSDVSGAAELRLEEAIAQLRRARKHCRAGSGGVARADYLALEQFSTTYHAQKPNL